MWVGIIQSAEGQNNIKRQGKDELAFSAWTEVSSSPWTLIGVIFLHFRLIYIYIHNYFSDL